MVTKGRIDKANRLAQSEAVAALTRGNLSTPVDAFWPGLYGPHNHFSDFLGEPMQKRIAAAILAILMWFAITASLAQDDVSTRIAAADRYLKAVPVSRMLDTTFAEIGKQLPEDQRAQFVNQMKAIVRADVLERIARDTMVNTFTTDELNALANFYESQHGASAMEKFGIYMGQVMPAVQQELHRAIQQMEAQEKNE